MIGRNRRIRDLDKQLADARREAEWVETKAKQREPLLDRLEKQAEKNAFAERLVAFLRDGRRHA